MSGLNAPSIPLESWAGLHDDVPDRPSAKVKLSLFI